MPSVGITTIPQYPPGGEIVTPSTSPGWPGRVGEAIKNIEGKQYGIWKGFTDPSVPEPSRRPDPDSLKAGVYDLEGLRRSMSPEERYDLEAEGVIATPFSVLPTKSQYMPDKQGYTAADREAQRSKEWDSAIKWLEDNEDFLKSRRKDGTKKIMPDLPETERVFQEIEEGEEDNAANFIKTNKDKIIEEGTDPAEELQAFKEVLNQSRTGPAGQEGAAGLLGLSPTDQRRVAHGFAQSAINALENGKLDLEWVTQIPLDPATLINMTQTLRGLVTQHLEQEYRKTLLEPEERKTYERRAKQFEKDLELIADKLVGTKFERSMDQQRQAEIQRQFDLEQDLAREELATSQQTAMFQAALQNPYAFAAFQQMQGGVNPFQAALSNLGFQAPGAQMPPVPGFPPAAMAGVGVPPMGAPVAPTPGTVYGTGPEVDPMLRGEPIAPTPTPPMAGQVYGTGFDVDPMMRGEPMMPPTVGAIPTAPAMMRGEAQPALTYGTGLDVDPMMRGEPMVPYAGTTEPVEQQVSQPLAMPEFARAPVYGQPAAFFGEAGLPTIGALRQTDPEALEYLNAILGYAGISPRQFAQQVSAITPGVGGTRIRGGLGPRAARFGYRGR